MLKKCALYIGGFMRLSTLIIIVILGVTVYFYQDKVREVGLNLYEKNSQSGPLFYISGIWNRIKNVQKMQENSNQRALELLGNTKTINDSGNFYSLDVSENWKIISSQGISGNQLSKIVLESPNFSTRNEAADIFYDSGAQLIVSVAKGESPIAKSSEGGHGKMFITKHDVQINGENYSYYAYRDEHVKIGDLIDAYYVSNGNTYHFNYVFNSAKFQAGEYTFQEILNSFKIKNKK